MEAGGKVEVAVRREANAAEAIRSLDVASFANQKSMWPESAGRAENRWK